MQNENEALEMFQKAKERLENWPLLKVSPEEKIQWVKDTLVPVVAKITLSGDRVEEIIVVENLYDAIVAGLEEAPLPADFPDQQNLSRDILEREFREYCKLINVRTATVEQLAIAEEVPPDAQFIRPVTSRMKIQGFLDHWDQSIGFTESLKMMNCPLSFSMEDKKLLFGLMHMMNLIGAQSAPQSEANSDVKMFNL